MTSGTIAKSFPADSALTLVDVGSAGGLQPRWRPFEPILSAVLFDPREAAPTGALGRGQRRVYPVALGAEAGEAKLHILALPNMSSVLPPNRELLSGFRKKGAHSEVMSTEALPIEPLDAIAARDGFAPDVLKVDTQGSELQILEGARDALDRSVLLAEVEVSFLERYSGQPLFDDIVRHMRGHGFDLIELSRLKRYRALNKAGVANVGLGRGQRAGRVAYGDAIFLKNEATILERGGLAVAKAIVALVAYGKPDMAARLFDRGADLLAPEVRDRMGAALRGLGKPAFGMRHLHAAVDWLGRKV
jgi:FkbM family methyltransferase